MKKNNKWLLLICSSLLIMSSCSSKLEVTPPNSIYDEQIDQILKGNDEVKINLVLETLTTALSQNLRLNGSFDGYSSSSPENSYIGQNMLLNVRCNDMIVGTNGTSDLSATYYRLDPTQMLWNASGNTTLTFWKMAAEPSSSANKANKYVTDEVVAQKAPDIPEIYAYKAKILTSWAFGYMTLMDRYRDAYMTKGKDGKGMPLYYTTDLGYTPESPNTAPETYKAIISALQKAEKYFEESGEGEIDGFLAKTVTNKKELDRGMALFLLARASLYTGEYDICIDACEKLLARYPSFIAESAYGVKESLVPDLCAGTADVNYSENAFLSIDPAINPEVIFGCANGEAETTTPVQYSNNLYLFLNPFSTYSSGGYGTSYKRIDDRLYKLIDPNDFRKDIFLTQSGLEYTYPKVGSDAIRTNALPTYTNLKWAATISAGYTTRTEYNDSDLVSFRSSEVWLMLAEAQAQSGDEAGAKATLNKLLAARTKQGVTPLTCDTYQGMSGMSVMDMVKLQWRIEMWGENGLEYFNLRRWNDKVDRLGSTVHYSFIGWSPATDTNTFEVPIVEQTTGNW